MNQCWNIVKWTFGNKLQWNFNLNSDIFIKKMHLNVSSEKWQTFCFSPNVLKVLVLADLNNLQSYIKALACWVFHYFIYNLWNWRILKFIHSCYEKLLCIPVFNTLLVAAALTCYSFVWGHYPWEWDNILQGKLAQMANMSAFASTAGTKNNQIQKMSYCSEKYMVWNKYWIFHYEQW